MRRKHERFPVKDDTYALLSSPEFEEFERMGQLIDIGRGGLAFHYVAIGGHKSMDELNGTVVLKVFRPSASMVIEQCKLVYDIPLDEGVFHNVCLRRCGIQFDEVPQRKISRLEVLARV